MQTPNPGDVIIRSSGNGYVVVEAVSHRTLAGPITSFNAALKIAKQHTGESHRIWQQSEDNRGRVLGELFSLAS